MVNPVFIAPQAIYDDGAVSLALGIPPTTLNRARRDGTLRYTRKGKRVLYLGKWLLAWLEADANAVEVATVADR
jgi:hypothetical protein